MVANVPDGVEKCSNISLFEFRIYRLATKIHIQYLLVSKEYMRRQVKPQDNQTAKFSTNRFSVRKKECQVVATVIPMSKYLKKLSSNL